MTGHQNHEEEKPKINDCGNGLAFCTQCHEIFNKILNPI
jgi:hypothetical protein